MEFIPTRERTVAQQKQRYPVLRLEQLILNLPRVRLFRGVA